MRVSMGVSYRIENLLAALEVQTEAFEELNHGRVVGNEKLSAMNRQRKMAVADFEGYADCSVRVGRCESENRLRSSFDFQIPIGLDDKNCSGRENCAGGESERDCASVSGREAAADPAALLGGEHESVLRLAAEIVRRVLAGDLIDDEGSVRHRSVFQKRK